MHIPFRKRLQIETLPLDCMGRVPFNRGMLSEPFPSSLHTASTTLLEIFGSISDLFCCHLGAL